MLYSIDEICLIPAAVSPIKHRGDVIIYNNHDMLPIFSAPMGCVIDEHNYSTFEDVGINTIIPRTVHWDDRYEFIEEGKWVAVGYKEAKWLYNLWKEDVEVGGLQENKIHLCIDQADGHLEDLITLCFELKELLGNHIKIMTGNVANPFVYKEYARAGIDYIRVGVGGGSACTTSVQTGMHYPMGSLIINTNKERKKVEEEIAFGAQYRSVPKIIADGGFKRIDQCVKALALGADYVMLGETLAKSQEACGKSCYIDSDNRIYDESEYYPDTHREYYGMSTVKAQHLINKASALFGDDNFKPKHSEGQVRFVKIEYPIKNWVNDFEHALRSSMSYAGARTLKDFIGEVEYHYMTPVTYNAYMK